MIGDASGVELFFEIAASLAIGETSSFSLYKLEESRGRKFQEGAARFGAGQRQFCF